MGGMFIINGKGFSMWTASKPSASTASKKQDNQKAKETSKQKDAAVAASGQAKVDVKLIDTTGLTTYREYYDDTYKVSDRSEFLY